MKGTVYIIPADSKKDVKIHRFRDEVPDKFWDAEIGTSRKCISNFTTFVRWKGGHDGERRLRNCLAYYSELGRLQNHRANILYDEALGRQNMSRLGQGFVVEEQLLGHIAIVWGDKEFMQTL